MFSILIAIDVLILCLVSASLCYSIHECWGPVDSKDTSPLNYEVVGYVNVSGRFYKLGLVGLVSLVIHIGSMFSLIIHHSKFGASLFIYMTCVLLFWLISVSLFRHSHAAKVCSADFANKSHEEPYIAVEGTLLLAVETIMWGLGSLIGIILCCAANSGEAVAFGTATILSEFLDALCTCFC